MNTGQIVKGRPKRDFAIIPNEIAQSEELTMEEKGMLCYLLSLPDNWVLYKKNLYEKLPDKPFAIDRVFGLLQQKGYILSVRVIDTESHKFVGWNHVVYDEPTLEPTLSLAELGESRESVIAELGKTSPIKRNTTAKKKEPRIKKEFVPPDLETVKEFFIWSGYTISTANDFFRYYSPDWTDSKGKQVKDWKAKARKIWFRDDNAVQDSSPLIENPQQYLGYRPDLHSFPNYHHTLIDVEGVKTWRYEGKMVM